MRRVREETEKRHVSWFFYFSLVTTMCGLPIQRVQAESVDSLAMQHQAATQTKTEPPGQRPDERIVKAAEVDSFRVGNKLMAGLGGGIVGAFLGAFIMADLYQAKDGDDILGGLGAFTKGLEGGYVVGTATGVSWVDMQDDFFITLAGSVLGLGVPVGAIDVISTKTGWKLDTLAGVSAFLGPIVGATIASERWRKPLSAKRHLKPEARRVSVGLVPDLKGGLSAIATLRF